MCPAVLWPHLVECAVQVDGCRLLSMHADDVCASLGKVSDTQLRLNNHLQIGETAGTNAREHNDRTVKRAGRVSKCNVKK